MKRPGMPFHPMLNHHGMRGPMSPNMHNGNHLHRPPGNFNHRMMPPNMNKGFFPNNQQRNHNFMKNGDINRRNFETFGRFDMRRDHQNGGEGGGGRIRRDSDAEWEEWQRARQNDEYAGLMTPREKTWLRNIQGMQLQTENPYQDDYYFVVSNFVRNN